MSYHPYDEIFGGDIRMPMHLVEELGEAGLLARQTHEWDPCLPITDKVIEAARRASPSDAFISLMEREIAERGASAIPSEPYRKDIYLLEATTDYVAHTRGNKADMKQGHVNYINYHWERATYYFYWHREHADGLAAAESERRPDAPVCGEITP